MHLCPCLEILYSRHCGITSNDLRQLDLPNSNCHLPYFLASLIHRIFAAIKLADVVVCPQSGHTCHHCSPICITIMSDSVKGQSAVNHLPVKLQSVSNLQISISLQIKIMVVSLHGGGGDGTSCGCWCCYKTPVLSDSGETNTSARYNRKHKVN